METRLDISTVQRESVCSLDEILGYKNDMIIHKFIESFDLSFEDTEDLFRETLKWLWINAIAIEERTRDISAPELFIDRPMSLLDEMWHCFILFTQPYEDFCNQYFGFFIHHAPTTKAEKDEMKREADENHQAYQEKMEKEYALQYDYIYEKLGEDTLVKWYSDYTDTYTPEYINDIRKPYQ